MDEESAREGMIELLEAEGVITDEDVARAMRAVSRLSYMGEEAAPFAYELQETPVAEHVLALNARTISELLSAARPAEGMKVLTLGTSTGYVEALLHEIGCTVSCVEPNEGQRAWASEHLIQDGRSIAFVELADADRYDLVIALKSLERIDPRVLAFTPYGRTMLVVGEEKTLIALDYRGDMAHPEVSYSGSLWLPPFDPPLLDDQPYEPTER